MDEPIAVVGIGALWPGARGAAQFWDALAGDRAPGALPEVDVDLARFRIPPAQAGTLPRLQSAVFEVAAQCMSDAGHPARPLPVATTDVLVATAGALDRHQANAARMDAVRYADALERASLDHPARDRIDGPVGDQLVQAALRRFGASPHDRVGEMASSIPARVAAAYGLHGRTVALESAELTGLVVLAQAMHALRAGAADAVLAVGGRLHEGGAGDQARAAKRLGALHEGIVGLVLMRASDAADRRVYATVRSCALRHAPRRGTFRHPADASLLASAIAAADAADAPATVSFGPGAAFDGAFAGDGLAALAAAALAISRGALPRDRLPVRTAAVAGTSLYGSAGCARLDAAEPRPAPATVLEAPRPVAVLAAAGRFAGARDVDEFWAATSAPDGQFSLLSQQILDRRLFHRVGGLSLRHSYVEHGAPVPDVVTAPPGVPLPPARRAALDPAQRLALDVAADLFGRRIEAGALRGEGLVAIGSSLASATDRELGARSRRHELDELLRTLPALADLDGTEREELVKLARDELAGPELAESPYLLDALLAGGIPALIANEFGLAATPVAVEAACASALAAIDFAMAALRAGQADFAVAGGVEIACTTRDLVLCSALGLLSPTRIAPFGELANGFTPGDGCALFALKLLEDAERDGDPIAAVLRGVGAANDAKSLIAPDADGQELALRRAFAGLDLAPGAVDYIEAHGTGTAVGDRVEVDALRRVYGGARATPLTIGTAKGSFGHTFAAAGGAGLLRVLEGLRRRELPPTARLGRLNPELRLDELPARLLSRPAPWPASAPRRAAVSSFGTGGINYHLLVEEHSCS